MEGFVVTDKNWHRIKIKSPEYLIYHHLTNNGLIDKKKAWEMIHTDDFRLEDFKEAASEINIKAMEYYMKSFENARLSAVSEINRTRKLRNEGLSRKDIAISIKNSKFAYFGFRGLDTDGPPEQIVDNTDTNRFLKFIEDFTNDIGDQSTDT